MDLDRLTKIDSRWIFVVFLIACGVPILKPLGLPIRISDNTRTVYNAVEDVPEGGLIVIALDFSFDNRGELQPMAKILLHHALTRDVKVVMNSFYSMTSDLLVDELLKDGTIESYGKTYGVDFVNLGWILGQEKSVAAYGQDVHSVAEVDYYGTPVTELPLMDSFHSAADIDLYICMSAGTIFPEVYFRQLQSFFDTKITGGSVGLIYAPLIPYISTGQLSGFLPSLRGAAEYELMNNKPGIAVVGMDSQSLIHLVVVGVIVLCNIGILGKRLSGASAED